MKPLFLRIKGFKGIKAGMNLDEVTLDLSGLPRGICAFDAPNGTGKTTIIDNLTPYRFMPYRASSFSPKAFSYYDHVNGEAEKELLFEMDGRIFKSILLISGKRKKQEAYLYEKRGDSFVPLNPDGKTETYDRLVEEICGSADLFFTSIFRCQNARSISDYTKGELKEILSELLGLNEMRQISEKARMVKREISAVILGKSGEIEALELKKDGIENLKSRIDAVKQRLGFLETELNRTKARKDELSTLLTEIETKERVFEEKRMLVEKHLREVEEEKRRVLSRYEESQKSLLSRITNIRDQISREADLRARLLKIEKLEGDLSYMTVERENLERKVEELRRNQRELMEKRVTLLKKEADLRQLEEERKRKTVLLQEKLRDAETASSILDRVPCGDLANSCPLATDAVKKKLAVQELKFELTRISAPSEEEDQLRKEVENIAEVQELIQGVERELEEASTKLSEIRKRISDTESRLREGEKIRQELASLQSLSSMLPELERDLDRVETEKTQRIQELEQRSRDLRMELDKIPRPDHQGKQKTVSSLNELQNRILSLESEISLLHREIGTLERMMEEAIEAEKRHAQLAEELEILKKHEKDFSLLERAFGPDGIIALEIDAAGPLISSIANDLLAVFGGRFSIRIDTLKQTKAAPKETLEIVVYDAMTGELKNLRIMSGGERVWIEDAITRAIAIVRQQRSGKKYLTLFTDEKDGALDAVRKVEFFEMKRKILEIGQYEREFCITQTPSLLEFCDAVIRLERGKGIEIIT
jgi:exonuclease SbcC